MLLLLPTICGVSMFFFNLTGKPDDEATDDDLAKQRIAGVITLVLTVLIGSGR
jgi:hypothetical protein